MDVYTMKNKLCFWTLLLTLLLMCPLVLLASSNEVVKNNKIPEKKYILVVTSKGHAEKMQIALENALKNAIKAHFGMDMMGSSQKSMLMLNNDEESFSSEFKQKVKQTYGGKIRRYKILDISKNKHNEYVISVKIELDLREKEILNRVKKIQNADICMETLKSLHELRDLVPADSNSRILESINMSIAVGALIIENVKLYDREKTKVSNFKYFTSKITEVCSDCSGQKNLVYICPTCNGTGACKTCYGRGYRSAPSLGGIGRSASVNCNPHCSTCGGQGRVAGECQWCSGRGNRYNKNFATAFYHKSLQEVVDIINERQIDETTTVEIDEEGEVHETQTYSKSYNH